MLLCLRPEQWAEQARYPFLVTFLPLLAIIFLAGLLTGLGESRTAMLNLRQFANTYDKHYAPMLFSNGKLTLQSPSPSTTNPASTQPATQSTAKEPIVKLQINGNQLIVDPTGATTVESLGDTPGILIDATKISMNFGFASSQRTLHDFCEQPPFDQIIPQPWHINSPGLKAVVDQHGTFFFLFIASIHAIASMIRDLFWSLAMIFFLTPFVNIGCLQLRMPQRIRFRISAAVVIPLVLVGGILNLLDASPSQLIGLDYSLWLWLACASALAMWSGFMANHMYRRILK